MVYTVVLHLTAKEDSVAALKSKLVEASSVFSRDHETLSWRVVQDASDPKRFTVVERYLKESSYKYHVDNAYWKTFDPEVNRLLEKPVDVWRGEELEGAGGGAGTHVHEEARGDTSLGSMYVDSV